MTIARSTRENFDFVLESDRALPPDQQTVFTLRRLSNAAMLQLENLITLNKDGETVSWRSGDAKVVALRAGLVGWKGLRDESGNEVPFKREEGRKLVYGIQVDDPASMESLDRLTTADARELADAIMVGNRLSRDDAKK